MSEVEKFWVDATNPDNGVEYFRDDAFNLVDTNGKNSR